MTGPSGPRGGPRGDGGALISSPREVGEFL